MKLREIPPGSKIRLDIGRIGSPDITSQICTFHYIDGMYSYITTPDGQVVHLSASQPLVLKGGVYELKAEPFAKGRASVNI